MILGSGSSSTETASSPWNGPLRRSFLATAPYGGDPLPHAAPVDPARTAVALGSSGLLSRSLFLSGPSVPPGGESQAGPTPRQEDIPCFGVHRAAASGTHGAPRRRRHT